MIRIDNMAGQRVFRGGLTVLFVIILLTAWAQGAVSNNWRAVGEGDCPGQDVAESTGPNPDDLKCTDAFLGQTAVCREQSCTYKSIETASCTGGASPGRMFTCSPVDVSGSKPEVSASKTDVSGNKTDVNGSKTDSVIPITPVAPVTPITPVAPAASGGMQPLTPPSDPVIYMNSNSRGVQNGPTKATTFVINTPHLVTFIYTYHYLNGGKLPGKIGLKHADGTIYGPWRAEGAVGPGGVPNAYWFVLPYVELKAGSYTVTDTDIETWSYNRRSSNAGFVVIRGFRR